MYGSFNEDAQQAWDFARCQRPNGTFYGTRGKCRSGDEVGAKEEVPAKPAAKKKRPAVKKAAAKKPVAKKKAAVKTPTAKKKKSSPAKAKKALEKATPEQLEKLKSNPRVTPEQKKVLDKAIAEKKQKPVEPPKPEEKGYKPREREERKGLRGLKDRLLGGRGKDLDKLIPNEKEVYEARDGYKQTLYSRLTSGADKATVDRINKAIDRADRNAALEVSRIGTNRRFVEDLKANLPPNVKASVDDENGTLILRQRVGRNTIETTFNQDEGFNYRVNGKYDVGTVKDRKEQLRIAMAVRNQYDALVRSLPEGSVIKTSPYSADGKGEARQKAYERIGFSKPNEADEMYAMKKDGKMVPASFEQFNAAFENPDTVWFAEESELDDKEQTKIWLQIITGQSLGES